jgi:signal transduction histidine kinase
MADRSLLSRLSGQFAMGSADGRDEPSVEVNQWHFRFLVVGACVLLAVAFSWVNQGRLYFNPWSRQFFLASAGYAFVGAMLYAWTRARPGHYPVRRLAAIILDAAALSYGIILNPTVTLPLFAAMVFIVTGNGLRYGRSYLIAAAVTVQIALFCIYAIVPFDEQYAHVAITMSLTAIVLPVHAYIMLKRTETARREAEAANRAKSRFLSQASHDLRQPLHACAMLAGNLRDKALTPEALSIVDRIERTLANASGLFRSLLHASMLESGKLTPQLEPVDLGALIGEVAAANEAVAKLAKCDIRVVDTQSHGLTDRALLQSMIQNLVSNALQHANGTVLIGVRRRLGGAAVEVWDNGPGIAPDDIPFIFDEYYRTENNITGNPAGAGLGLANVRGLATLLGMVASAKSIEGKGTCVAISGLKLVAPLPGPRPGRLAGISNALAAPLRDFRILFIEDDSDVLATTADMMRQWGCKVDASLTIPERIDKPFDVLVTDFDLGRGQTGIDAIAIFRAARGGAAPVVVLTGMASRVTPQLNDVPLVTILEKPVHPADLRSLLGSIRLHGQFALSAPPCPPEASDRA